ncbi:permease [Chlorogloeopsis sp. ULAP02]|uniref:permease n=1 Tax=Chlorogloeopsis sp. ULAP02 TaxID=3107926 RepID=UPI0031368456
MQTKFSYIDYVMLNQIIQALLASAGILWKSFWALVFGYTISAVIQVLVNRCGMARVLGKRSWKQVTLAGLFGLISSSCSLPAIAVYVCIIVAAITVHEIFALCGVLPVERSMLTQVYRFSIDYTLWLNMIFAVLGGVLVWLHWQNKHVYQAADTEQYSQQEVAKS